ncbi:MAG: hypothetical protein C5B49_11755 [Bdellovibrio sp.]|nr:MAG: hypothetical protein C5B49_11755 [Bdellovibrio sp.]
MSMYVPRLIESALNNSTKSALLLGPRQTGKSTLIGKLKPELTLNLADETLFVELSSDLQAFKDRVESRPYKTIFVDEIQRMPELLNLVQFYIDQRKGMRFYLTGSSARKLRRGGANLLPGRVINYFLGPLVAKEADYAFATMAVLNYGTLPEIYSIEDEKSRQSILRSYSVSYLKEEIQHEALVRNLPSFARFFHVACQSVGQLIDYTKIAKAAKVSRHSIPRFFEILEDTMVATRIYPFEPAIESADLIKHPRFFLFDNGVFNGLLGNFNASIDRRGPLMEQLVFNQIKDSCGALEKSFKASTFRTRGGLEIDFIFEVEGDTIAVEVKSSDNIQSEDLRGLKSFPNHYPRKHLSMVLHAGSREIKKEGIWCLPL